MSAIEATPKEATPKVSSIRIAAYSPKATAETAQVELERYSIAHLFGYEDASQDMALCSQNKGPLLEALAKVPVAVLLPYLPDEVREALLAHVADDVMGHTAGKVVGGDSSFQDYIDEFNRQRCRLEIAV